MCVCVCVGGWVWWEVGGGGVQLDKLTKYVYNILELLGFPPKIPLPPPYPQFQCCFEHNA